MDTLQYMDGENPWGIKADIAFPCATQNEIDESDAKRLVQNGIKGVFEGANMPSSNQAIAHFKKNKIIFGPAKAVNAGGVAVSGLEMAQQSQRVYWTRQEVDEKLHDIMKRIYATSKRAAKEYGDENDLQMGANIAGFLKVADSMIAQGCV